MTLEGEGKHNPVMVAFRYGCMYRNGKNNRDRDKKSIFVLRKNDVRVI
jgi:hypothetical protein